MRNRAARFLNKLADLLEEYDAELDYTNSDDGIHVTVNQEKLK